jgi:signal transduction histidine kinase
VVSLPPWPAVATLAVGVANLVLLAYIWPWREEPGGWWFLVVIAVQVVWCFTYGVALFVFDPAIREALEIVTWLPISWIGVFFLAFALEYTGRVDLLHSSAFGVAVAFEVILTALVVTNPLHNLVWRGFAIAPAFGAATATYTHHAPVFVQYVALFAFSTLGIFLLLDTVISYGPLFRKQALAIALTPIPPAAAFTVWVFKLGPVPQFNLTPLMFLPHMLLDMYALFRNDMFEFKPATRRSAERAAIDDIGTAVVITDQEGRVITLNDAAGETFGVDRRDVLAAPLGTLYEGELAVESGEWAASLRVGGHHREFNVAVTTLADAAGTEVGYTVGFVDVTDERQRKQRLGVLNRILRHNLRNDLNVVVNYADLLASRSDDDVAEYAETIQQTSLDLVELGAKARRAATALDGERHLVEHDLAALLADVTADVGEEHPDGSVTCDVPEGVRVETDVRLLNLVVRSLVENGIGHGGGTVTVAYEGRDEESVLLTVSDDGPGIPEHELAVLEAGEESALEHGSGLGLWLVKWGTTALGGEVSFETPTEGGTRVTLRLPGLVSSEGTGAT